MKPKLAIWKFSSCDGCQLSLLDCEQELLQLTDRVEIAHFLEASRATTPGPYDLSLVEGAISTAEEVERIRRIREQSRQLVAIGACATAGGIQALRNLLDFDEVGRRVYARPEYIQALPTATAIADHVPVDFELRGCPIDKGQLLELINAFLNQRRPDIPAWSQCQECKMEGTVCVLVARGTPCLGPVTQAGCGNRCPAVGRGCYGCFGPAEQPDTVALSRRLEELGMDADALRRYYRLFNAEAPAFREESARHE